MEKETFSDRPRCINLTCKSMIVYGEGFEMDPDYQAGITEFWCQCTSRNQGPDGDSVSLEQCCDTERPCFKEY